MDVYIYIMYIYLYIDNQAKDLEMEVYPRS